MPAEPVRRSQPYADSPWRGQSERERQRAQASLTWVELLDRLEDSVRSATAAAETADADTALELLGEVAADLPDPAALGPVPADLVLRARQLVAAQAQARKTLEARVEEVRSEISAMSARSRRGNAAPTGLGQTLDIDA